MRARKWGVRGKPATVGDRTAHKPTQEVCRNSCFCRVRWHLLNGGEWLTTLYQLLVGRARCGPGDGPGRASRRCQHRCGCCPEHPTSPGHFGRLRGRVSSLGGHHGAAMEGGQGDASILWIVPAARTLSSGKNHTPLFWR